ncbi:MAG: 16S rRNA (cytidine(1402)-2'-O)-methyltransferase [Megasphaera sp.]|nr:16S rRNA (cytidine(1402)-2'-O)-methyltransferase [Megasphaera sp.]MCH4188287.1 16S rRNA (cytidine(1402)-2'-O)-methyltransferase [Megasphaera sp.]MCH4218414.1 16S rRNA (cytidine(1402)-2'-O)-methyltransferase [Megasphaera sp.]
MAEVFQKGTLYLVATPIGNMEDITYRAVRCLREADLIAAEDTRHTKFLLSAYGIDTPMTSYHEHNKAEKGPHLIEKLQEGSMIALVSDAGMPAICDPGSDMVRLALEAGIPIVPVPGANAGLTGLIASGMDTERFTFVGFLPKTKKHRLPVLASLTSYEGTLIFYEAPHRIGQVLGEICEVLGDRQAVLCRELTKRYEQYMHGSLRVLQQQLAQQGPRGEFVILVAGAPPMTEAAADGTVDYASLVQELMNQGVDKKEAIRMVARQCGVQKRSVYQAALTL